MCRVRGPSSAFAAASGELPVVDVVGIQIAVGFLHRYDFVDRLLGAHAESGTSPRLQRKSNRFRPFINIGVGIDRPVLCGVALANQTAKIIHAAVGFQKIMHRRDTLGDVSLATGSPKSHLDGNGTYRNVPQLGSSANFGESSIP